MKPSIRLEHALVAVESEHDVNVMLELAAPAPDASKVRPPIAVALVLDRSGSMHGAPLETAKRAAAWLVDRLGPDDRVAVVTFDSGVDVVAHPMTPSPQLVHAIGAIQSGGMTNLSGGWLKGRELLAGLDAALPRTLLLLTDGQANEGIADRGQLTSLAQLAAEAGITTTTIGFGDGFDEDLLLAMADAGRGNAHYAASVEDLPGIFGREVDGLTQLVAQNVSAEIRPADEVELVTIWNEAPATEVPGGLLLELGDAYAGETRRLVVTFHVPHLPRLGPAAVAEYIVRSTTVGATIAQHTLTVPVVVNVVSADEAAAQAPDLAVREEIEILAAARARDEAIRRADAGDTQAAGLVLRGSADALRAAPSSPRILAELDEIDAVMSRINEYSPALRKQLRYEANQKRRDRGR